MMRKMERSSKYPRILLSINFEGHLWFSRKKKTCTVPNKEIIFPTDPQLARCRNGSYIFLILYMMITSNPPQRKEIWAQKIADKKSPRHGWIRFNYTSFSTLTELLLSGKRSDMIFKKSFFLNFHELSWTKKYFVGKILWSIFTPPFITKNFF